MIALRSPVIGGLLRLAVLALVACGAWSTGCERTGPAGSAEAGEPARTWRITCTVGMVADIVRAVTGDRATVVNIVGEGVDPHLYTATRNDVTRLRDADIVFYCGLMLEGKMADALVKVARSGKPVYAVTELIDEQYLLEPPQFAGHFDPHVWMDVQGWMKAVEAVERTMSEVDPAGAPAYRANAAAYLEELGRLDDYARRAIASIPASTRVLITAHDAFNYFGRAYDIEVMGIQGISTESKAGVDDINRLVDLIVERGVSAAFVETSVNDKNVRALVQGAASRGRTLSIGGSLFSDAMGAPETYEGTYVGMVDHNVTTITRALGGDAPARGMHGRLASPSAEAPAS